MNKTVFKFFDVNLPMYIYMYILAYRAAFFLIHQIKGKNVGSLDTVQWRFRRREGRAQVA